MAHRYFLVYFIFTSCTVAGQSAKYALWGLKVHLKADITGPPDEILWKHKGNKVVEFSDFQRQVYGMFKNRVTLNKLTAELVITDLRYEDSGEYVLEAYKSNELSTSTFQLEVIDKVSTPTISCEMNEGSISDKSGTKAILMCSAESRQPQLMKFEWSSGGNVQPGPKLTISLGEKHDDEEYNCTVSNPLSSETATFTAKNCNPERSVLVAGIVISVIFGIIILCICVFFYIRWRKGKTNGNQSPHGSTGESEQGDMTFKEKVAHFNKKSEESKSRPPMSKHTKKNAGSEKKAEGAAQSPPAVHLRPPLTKRSPNVAPKDTAGEHEEDSKSDQVTEETVRESDSSDKKDPGSEKEAEGAAQSPSASAEPPPAVHLRPPLTKRSPNVAPKDTAGEHEEDSKSDQVTEETVRESDSSDKKDPGSEKEAEGAAQSPSASAEPPPAVQPRSLLTKTSPNVAPKDTAGEHEEDSKSDQVTEETVRESDSSDKKDPVSGSEKKADEDEEAPKDTAGEHEEKSDSDQATEETVRESKDSTKERSTIHEQKSQSVREQIKTFEDRKQ